MQIELEGFLVAFKKEITDNINELRHDVSKMREDIVASKVEQDERLDYLEEYREKHHDDIHKIKGGLQSLHTRLDALENKVVDLKESIDGPRQRRAQIVNRVIIGVISTAIIGGFAWMADLLYHVPSPDQQKIIMQLEKKGV